MRLKKVGVLGAGTAGRGIIQSLAASGLEVIFTELSQEKVEWAIEELTKSLDFERSRWGVTESEKRLILSRVRGTTDMRDMVGSQVVIEVIPCSMKEKQDIFTQMDAVFPTSTVLLSNTATICVSDLARYAKHPERIAGMHFSLPVPRRPIVEVIEGRKTSPETMGVVRLLAKLMRKEALDVFEMPGLITTRVMIPYINEAMNIVMEGIAPPEHVDEAIRLAFRLPIGPLAMADETGLDTLLHNMEHLFDALGELQYQPCPLLRRMVREGHLGVKTQVGFFYYDENGRMLGSPTEKIELV